VRIEVGYGLEGTLTDALASEIVEGTILPNFKAGHMEQGIVDGTTAIVSALGGKEALATSVDSAATDRFLSASPPNKPLVNFFCFLLIIFFILFRFIFLPFGMFGGGSGGFGGGFSGGFSGGGGGFGGGGASGGW
jgi:uncharacterized protein